MGHFCCYMYIEENLPSKDKFCSPSGTMLIFLPLKEGFLYSVLNSESPLREVPLYLSCKSNLR